MDIFGKSHRSQLGHTLVILGLIVNYALIVWGKLIIAYMLGEGSSGRHFWKRGMPANKRFTWLKPCLLPGLTLGYGER